jgi:hypothetical protein
MKRTLETLATALLLLGGAVLAQDPPKAPAGQKAGDLEATIVGLKGTVDVKRPEDKDWVPAERNMKLKKGSEVCTAVASTAKLLFTGNIQVDVKPLTQAKVEELAQAGGKVKADVNLKFGAVEVDIQKGDLKADMKVTAPNSTTSVSGSHGIVKAPAKGGGAMITLSTQTGTWSHKLEYLMTEKFIFGEGKANDRGDSLRDLYYRFETDKFLNYFGKGEDELYQDFFGHKAGDFFPWDVPLGEWGSTWPSSPKSHRPGTLPLPPGVPGP